MSPNKQLLISVAMMAVGFGLIARDSFNNRKLEVERQKRLAENEAKNEAFDKQMSDITDHLDRKLEAARYWDIVIRNLD